MSDIATREAELIARHAARDAYADSIYAAAKIALAARQALWAGSAAFSSELQSGWVTDSAGDNHFFVITYDEATGTSSTAYYTDPGLGTGSTPAAGALSPTLAHSLDLIEVGTEALAVDDTAGGQALTVPAGAVGAVIQVNMDTGFEASEIYYQVDGSVPSANDFQAKDGAVIHLGKTADSNGDTAELGNFLAIAQTGETANLAVIYYTIA